MSRWWWSGLVAGCVGSFSDVGVSETGISIDDGGIVSVRCETRVWEVGPTRPIAGTGTVWTVAEPGTPLTVVLGVDDADGEELIPVQTRDDAEGRTLVTWAREAGPLPPGEHVLLVRWSDGPTLEPCSPDVRADLDVRAATTPTDALADGVWSFEGFGQHPDAAALSRVLDGTRAGGRGLALHVAGTARSLAVHTRDPGFPEDGCVTAAPLATDADALTATDWSIPDDGGGEVHLRHVTASVSPREEGLASLDLSATVDLREATDRVALCGPDGPVARAGLSCGACPGDPDAQACAPLSFAATDLTLRPATNPASCPR